MLTLPHVESNNVVLILPQMFSCCRVNITFVDRDGDKHAVEARVGDTLLEVAKEYDIDLEGACEGTLSCSTCHLILSPEWYGKIPEPLTEEEQDMLDMAYGLEDT